MSDFEIIYKTDPSRELNFGVEKHPTIEMSDKDYIALHKKRSHERKMMCTPKIEEFIQKDEKDKSKSPKKKPGKNNS